MKQFGYGLGYGPAFAWAWLDVSFNRLLEASARGLKNLGRGLRVGAQHGEHDGLFGRSTHTDGEI